MECGIDDGEGLKGGGVVIGEGRFVRGGVELKSDVELDLDEKGYV